MLREELNRRGVMKIWEDDTPWCEKRVEIVELLQKEEYGYLPEKPTDLEFIVDEKTDAYFCAGRVEIKNITCKGKIYGREFSFPFVLCYPKNKKDLPFFVHINFRPDVPDKYMPTEEICDNGFAVLSFCYQDVTTDDADFTNGLAGAIFGGKERGPHDLGKIMMWAWAASRVMDYAMTLDFLDKGRGAVAGHSRLGKTALVTSMIDERFCCAFSNDSGCSGAAILREKTGEHLPFMREWIAYWFCEKYMEYADKENELPFDQHFLVAASAPRNVYVGSASEDSWADPNSEYLSCFAASEVYEKLGLKGFVCDDAFPTVPTSFTSGKIGYHLREGMHYFSRKDWHHYMEYMRRIGGK